MIKCKITNNTQGGLSLNWVRGGISIPKNSSAVLSYDPFSIMDRNSNVYHGAMETVRNGVVSIAYFAEPPATMIADINEVCPRPMGGRVAVDKEKAPAKNRAFNEFEPYHENEFKESVKTPNNTKPVENDEVKFDVNVPAETKMAEKRQESKVSEAATNDLPTTGTQSSEPSSTAKKKPSGSKTKKL